MRAYVITSGTIFGLVTVAHIARMISEEPALAKDPWYLLLTVATLGMCVWAWRVYRASRLPAA